VASLKKVEERTKRFIAEYERLSKRKDFPTHDALASIIGANGKNTITEILGKRQNIQPDQWDKFVVHFGISTDKPVRPKEQDIELSGQEKYLKLLEENDRFFKTQYHTILTNLSRLVEIGKRSEELIKLNLEHIGTVEALQKGVDPDVVHEQINIQIAELGPSEEMDNGGGS
jgi:hypothetical protein